MINRFLGKFSINSFYSKIIFFKILFKRKLQGSFDPLLIERSKNVKLYTVRARYNEPLGSSKNGSL